MKKSEVFNLDQKKKKITEEQKREHQKNIDDVRKILKTPEGRRYFWRKMSECGIFHSSFNPNSNQTAFNEGERNIGLGMLDEINEADVAAFAQMQNEYLSALNSKKEAKEAENDT